MAGIRKYSWTEGKTRWLEAMRWRRDLEKELKAFELTLARWLVLEATDELLQETGDAVNQSAVAARCELDRMTVSQVMRALETLGLVDRGAASSPHSYRIELTPKGRKLSGRVRRQIEGR